MRTAITTAILILLISAALAADTDQFDIVVQCQYLDISLKEASSHSTDFTTWDMGYVAAGGPAETMAVGSHIWVQNGCNMDIDLAAMVDSPEPPPCPYGTPTAWTAGAAPGSDQFQLDLGVGTPSAQPGSYTNITATTAPGDTYLTGAAAGVSHDLYARMTVPTDVSDGCQHTLTVYVIASPH